MSAELDYLRGRCTGIPECCIEFFVGPWSSNRAAYRSHHRAIAKHAVAGTLGVGYVPCPKCLASESFVQAQRCTTATCFCGQVEITAEARRKRVNAPPRRITVVVPGGTVPR